MLFMVIKTSKRKSFNVSCFLFFLCVWNFLVKEKKKKKLRITPNNLIHYTTQGQDI